MTMFDITAWRNDDPRYHFKNCGTILILYPKDESSFENRMPAIAKVNASSDDINPWSICIDKQFDDGVHDFISAHDSWNKNWWWCFFPKKKINKR